MQREQQHATKPEGEAERRRAGEDVVRGRPEQMTGEGVADRQDIAVEVHRRLRPTGCARREGEQGNVVGGRRDVVEPVRLVRHQHGETGVTAVLDRVDVEVLGGVQESMVDQGGVEPGDFVDGREFAGAEQGHRRDHHGARLQRPEPARREPGVVGAAQQDPVAGHDPEVLDQDMGDPVRGSQQVAVRPGGGAGEVQARAVGAVPLDDVVQQCGGAVEPIRVAELGQLEGQLRPLCGRWQVVATEGVDMGGRKQLHVRQRMARIQRPSRARHTAPVVEGGRPGARLETTSRFRVSRRSLHNLLNHRACRRPHR